MVIEMVQHSMIEMVIETVERMVEHSMTEMVIEMVEMVQHSVNEMVIEMVIEMVEHSMTEMVEKIPVEGMVRDLKSVMKGLMSVISHRYLKKSHFHFG